MFMYKIITLSIIIFLSTPVISQTAKAPLITDRPDQTESPLTVPVNSLQIEIGFLYSNDKNKANKIEIGTESFEFGSTLFRYGLTESVELRLSGGFIRETVSTPDSSVNKNGISGVKIGTKIYLVGENGLIPETAVIVDFGIPIGSNSFTSKKVIPRFIFAMGHTLSDFFSFSYNLGGVFREDKIFNLIYSAVLGMGLSDKLGAFVEGYGSKPSNSKTRFLLDAGLTYLILPNLQIDTSIGQAITKEEPDWFINLGVSIRLPN
jgi:hypothetical protein